MILITNRPIIINARRALTIMVALMLRQVVGFYSRFQFKNMGNAQTAIYIIFNTNLLHNIFINYCSDMFWPQFFAIFREHI